MESDFDSLINSNKSRIEPFNLQFTPSSKRLPYLLFPSHVFKISNVWNKYLLLIDEFLLRLNLEKIRNINRINFFHLKIKSVNLLESSVIDFKFVKKLVLPSTTPSASLWISMSYCISTPWSSNFNSSLFTVCFTICLWYVDCHVHPVIGTQTLVIQICHRRVHWRIKRIFRFISSHRWARSLGW